LIIYEVRSGGEQQILFGFAQDRLIERPGAVICAGIGPAMATVAWVDAFRS